VVRTSSSLSPFLSFLSLLFYFFFFPFYHCYARFLWGAPLVVSTFVPFVYVFLINHFTQSRIHLSDSLQPNQTPITGLCQARTVPNVRPSNNIQAGRCGSGVHNCAEYMYKPHIFRCVPPNSLESGRRERAFTEARGGRLRLSITPAEMQQTLHVLVSPHTPLTIACFFLGSLPTRPLLVDNIESDTPSPCRLNSTSHFPLRC
jgi:hypothetical protein